MSSNLPPGISEDDPFMPWNYDPKKLKECYECEGTGKVEGEDGELEECSTCEGTGYVDPRDLGEEDETYPE